MSDLADIRFQIIAPLLHRYKRRFTLLDLGAGINPYMAQRISREFDALVVAVEQNEIVPEECEKFGPRALWLRHKMTALDLVRLSCCEHFDTVTALNFLHHFGADWYLAAKAIESMANFVIVQTPYAHDKATCGQDVIAPIYKWLEPHTMIGESVQFHGHMERPMCVIEQQGENSKLTMTNWDSPEDCCDVRIHSEFARKTIQLAHKGDEGPRPFFHGLNLWNFVQLGGAWPRKDAVLKLIREFPLPKEHHGDITPHNFLFDGKELFLIDGYEGWEFSDEGGLKATEEVVGDLLK